MFLSKRHCHRGRNSVTVPSVGEVLETDALRRRVGVCPVLLDASTE